MTMTTNRLLILILIILTGCNDRKDFHNVGETLVESVIENDTAKIKELFAYKMDSLTIERKKGIFAGLNEFKDRKYKLIKVDTTSTPSFFDEGVTFRYINSYFKIDSNYFKLTTRYERDDREEISIRTFNMDDLSSDCNYWLTRPYQPTQSIDFKRLVWNTDYYGKIFKSGKVEVQNKLSTDLDYIKFRVILKNNWTTFFNQTVTSYDKIYSGDIRSIDVPGMADLYAGFTISRDNLQFSCELIEVLPKPESSVCKKIAELKAIK
jgi:hypothetical protein